MLQTIGSLLINGSAHGNMPIWFLLSYFFVKIVFSFQQCRKPLNRMPIRYIPILCLLIPFILHFCFFRYPYYLANIFLGLYGYYIGFIFKTFSKSKENYIGIISAILYIGIYLLCKPSLDIRTNTLYSGYYLLWALWAVSGCLFFYYFIKKLRWICTFLQIIGIAKAGELSMSILIIHWPILLIGDYIRKVFLSIPESFLPIYYIGIVLFFVPLIHYILKHSKLKFLIGL